MKPWSTGSAYLNFLGDEGLDCAWSTRSSRRSTQRLRQLKKEWDPDNVFRNNQNIPPATA